jgi:hypothetical protein
MAKKGTPRSPSLELLIVVLRLFNRNSMVCAGTRDTWKFEGFSKKKKKLDHEDLLPLPPLIPIPGYSVSYL